MSPAWRFIKLTNGLKDNVVEPFNSEEDIIKRYKEYSATLLNYCEYKSIDYNLKRLINRYSVRCKGCNRLGLENRMLEMLLERQKYKWFLANPFIDLRSYLRINSLYNPPIIQSENCFSIIPCFGDEISKDRTMADGIILEIIGELHLQALTSQILGYASRYLEFPDYLQCGYAYFGIKNGCAFQFNNKCSGNLDLESGELVGVRMDQDKFYGCSFEAFMKVSGIKNIRNIKVKGYTKRMVSYDDLIKLKPKYIE